MWFSLFLVGCLLLGGFLIVMLAIGSAGMSLGSGGTSYVEEVTLRDNDSKNKVAVIDLAGLIASFSVDASGNNMVESIRQQFKWAREEDDVKAVLFRINSPGGEVLASDHIYEIIRDFHDECDKPVVAVMGALAASGGYYVAAPCNWIVAHELTITGSGKHKDMLSYDKREEDITPEERKIVQDLIDETFGRFKKIVREGRDLERRDKPGEGKVLADDWEDFADGRILSGTQALGQGFVDELGDLDTATDRALSLAGIPDADLIQYRQPLNLANLFQLFGKSEAKEIKIDLGVDLPKLKTGRLYFLSPLLLY